MIWWMIGSTIATLIIVPVVLTALDDYLRNLRP